LGKCCIFLRKKHPSSVHFLQSNKKCPQIAPPPLENGASELSGRKKCQHFPSKPGFPSGSLLKVALTHPVTQFQNREPQLKWWFKGKACLLCSPPSSAPTMGSFFLRSPILDFTWVKPASGPEFPAPLNPMLSEGFSMPALLFRNHVPPIVSAAFLKF